MEERILKELTEIKRYTLLQAKSVLTLDDVVLLTGLSKSHLYRLTCTHQIPFYKPNGKTVFFDRNEIEAWMRQNRVGTQQEAESGAIRYILDKEAGL
jgi:excisionase family DNA binding protein